MSVFCFLNLLVLKVFVSRLQKNVPVISASFMGIKMNKTKWLTAAVRPTGFLTNKILLGILASLLTVGQASLASSNPQNQPVSLVFVDTSVEDYQTLARQLPQNAEVIYLTPGENGLAQISSHLGNRPALDEIHLISHGREGEIQLGNLWLTSENVPTYQASLQKLGNALRPGGDILIYGCNVSAGPTGAEFLQSLASVTGKDVAASNNWTGDIAKGGDWVLESQTGAIEAQVLASADYNHVLPTLSAGDMVVVGWSAVNDTITFASLVDIPAGTVIKITDKGWDQATGAFTTSTTGDGVITWTTSSFISEGDLFTLYLGGSDAATTLTDVTNGGADLSADISTSTYTAADPMPISGDGVFIYQDADNNPYFIFGLNNTSSTNIDGTNWGTVASPTLTNSMIPDGFGSQNSLTNGTNAIGLTGGGSQLDNVQYTGVTTSANRATWLSRFANVANWSGDNTGTITTSIGTSNGSQVTMTPPLPTVTDGRISISGATGTGGAYKIGDTVTATWNNTAGGDNNTGITGVTVNFSQFGGGAAVVASASSNTWTATYTITAGAVDSTNRNVSVTATNAAGSTTTADTTNATADNVAPTVTDGRISISGASGTGGAFKIGDTVTATWNNTAGGDNNSDTISSVTVNFTQFGGGAAVAASNSSGTWTATYTVVAGAIDNTNRNVTVTATDNAGNATSTSDTSNATVDNIAPSVTSIAPAGGAVSSDTSVDFIVDFSESVSNVSTDDFTRVVTGSAAGTIASVSAASGDPITVTVGGISGSGTLKVNLNGSTNIVDDAGNSIAAYSTGTAHTVNILTAPDAPTIGTATPGDGQVDITFTAPGSNGGSAITTYTATANPGGATGNCAGPAACTITVGSLTNGTAYTFTVTATNAIGTSTASGASNSATPKANQTITFANPGARNFGTTPTLSATATSSLTVSFTSSTTGVCTITSGGALTFVTAGTCTIDANQAGNASTNAAPTVSRTFTVNPVVPGAPTIGTATAGNSQATVTFAAPASTGGAAILAGGYTVTASPGGATGTGSGSPITVNGLTNGVSYTFTVTATNSAGTSAASAASNTIIPASPQTITFADPGAQNFGTAPDLSTLGAGVSSTSGLTVTFTSATTSVCTVTSGGLLAFIAAGTCTINANQAGDSSYLPAPQVSRSFTVVAVVSAAPTIGTAVAGDTQASVAFTPPINTGGASIINYTVSVSPPHVAPVNGSSSPIVVNGLTNGQAYTFTVTADNAAGVSPPSAASNSITPRSIQTITFANPGPRNFGTTPTLIATTDATGLTPTFTSSTTAVCTITSGGTLTFISAGTCTINADQAGDATYLPAPQVTNSFTVNAVVPGAPTIGTATGGNAQATVVFSVPASNGGSAITGYTVTASPGGVTASGAASPVTVTGLANGTSYTFNVRATNGAGTGSPSAASNAVTPNAAPSLSGSPATSVSEDTAYSFIPTATDSVGDTLTFSILNKPTWASFNTTTGALSGTPTNADVGTTTGIVISVSDGSLSASLAAFSLQVTNTNDAPTISGTPATSVAQDSAYSFIPTGADVDAGTTLTYSIANMPTWASFNTTTGALSGTPTNADVGTTTGIVISVSDGSLSASLAAFSLEVMNTNDAPTIAGTPATSVAQDAVYNFVPTGADVDAGTTLAYSIVNKPSWASFNTATGALTGTPTNSDIGTTSGIVISVSDGSLSASLAAFSLEVTNTNDAPTIAGTPTTSVAQDSAYSFIPTGVDVDAGTTLTYSIVNKPTWANFNTATGALTGTPTNADVGTTSAIVISVSDGSLSASLAAFSIEVTNTNDAPTISGTPSTSVVQDVAYSFIPTGADVDAGTTLTYGITNMPTWALFNTATGALSGTPTNADIGTTSGIVISVSDGTLSASLPPFNLEVTNVNDAPTIGGTPSTSVDQDAVYSFIPTATDPDTGDTLTFSISNKPAWVGFNPATGALTGIPTFADVGVYPGIVISVSDGTSSASLPAFGLTVVQTANPDAPELDAPADVTLNATALYTPVTLAQMLGLPGDATQAEIDQAIAALASDRADGNACCTTRPDGLNTNNRVLLAPGRHEVRWSTTNKLNLTDEAVQVINVKPLVSFSKPQTAIRGSQVEFRILLNGRSPVYPFEVAYGIDSTSTATSGEHNLVAGIAVFTEDNPLEVKVPVTINSGGSSDSSLVVNFTDNELNKGAANTHGISIRGGNVPPVVRLVMSQNGIETTQITAQDGQVSVRAEVTDLNPADTHSFDWSSTQGLADLDNDPINNTRVFDPASLAQGAYQVSVRVQDSAAGQSQAQLNFKLVATTPVLSADEDSDSDGVSDLDEGLDDSDQNGIPNYLDNMPGTNVLPQVGVITDAYLIECDPGVRCGLGLFALKGNSGGVQILNDELGALVNVIPDATFTPVGGIFDFVINDLPTPGQTVRIVIPQQAPIPANATYRKYQKGQWVSFVQNTNNTLHSAPGNPGYCPPPGSADWQPGLIAGHLCVQLGVEDGGPNDDDGLVNSSVSDPGVVSSAVPVVEPVEPVDIKTKGKGGGSLDIWVIALLLGVVVMMRKRNRVGRAVVLLAAISANTQANQWLDNSYLQLDLYQVNGSLSQSNLKSNLSNQGFDLDVTHFDDSRTAWSFSAGYEWNELTYSRIGYLDLGDVSLDLRVAGDTDMAALESALENTYPITASGFTLSQGLQMQLHPALSLSTELGVFIWDADIEVVEDRVNLSYNNEVDFMFGFRLDYQIATQMIIGLSTQEIRFDHQDLRLVGVSGRYEF